MELDEAQVRRLGLDPKGPRELSPAEMKLMGLPQDGPDSGINAAANTARIVGTDMARGVGRAGDEAKRLLGAPPGADLFKRMGLQQWQGAGGTKPLEALGVPTDPKAEAERLGAEYTGTRKALGAGARIATEIALMRGGARGSLLGGAGAGVGHALGGETGEAIGTLASLGGAVALSRRPPPSTSAPSVAEKFQEGRTLYRTADAENVVLSQASIEGARTRVQDTLSKLKKPIDADAHPKAALAMKKLDDLAARGDVPWNEFQIKRDVIRDLAQGATAKDADRIRTILREVDDYSRNVWKRPGEVLSGDAQKVADLYLKGDKSWAQAHRAQKVEKTIETAQTRASAPDLAIRNEFAALVRSPAFKAFPPEEQAMIRKLAEPSLTRKAMRAVSYIPYFVPGYKVALERAAGQNALGRAQSVSEFIRGARPPGQPQSIAEYFRNLPQVPPATNPLMRGGLVSGY